jgi:hypothetical protein
MLQRDGLAPGRVLNGGRSVTIADDSFPMLATMTPRPVN